MNSRSPAAAPVGLSPDRALAAKYRRVRAFSEAITAPLSAEDCVIQSMPDVSPTRWHLAHTTWFFETFLLKKFAQYQVFDPAFDFLFNSYYNTVGGQFPRHRRGMLSRPTVDQVLQYRKVGKWADYVYGEVVYIFLSLTAKSLLAWQIFGSTLQL